MAGCPSRRPSRSASQPQRPHFGFLALAACILGTQGERLYSAVDGETDGAGESGARAAPRAGRQVHHPQLSRGAAFRASFPPELARHVLDFVPFRYRLATHCGPSNATIWGPSRPRLQLSVEQGVVGVEFFPLGDMALTWDGAGRAVVWDAASGELLRELAGRVQAAGSPLAAPPARAPSGAWPRARRRHTSLRKARRAACGSRRFPAATGCSPGGVGTRPRCGAHHLGGLCAPPVGSRPTIAWQ